MGAVLWTFPNVPESDFGGIYADLANHSRPTPEIFVENITRAEMVAFLQVTAGAEIAAEISNNSEFYSVCEFTDAQIARIIQRLNLFEGFPYTPNLFTPEDITAAKG